MEGQKAQIVFLGVQCGVAFLLAEGATGRLDRGRSRHRLLKCAFGLAIGYEALIAIYAGFMSAVHQGGGVLQAHAAAASAVLRRVFLTQAEPLVQVFNLFPERMPHLGFRTFPLAEWAGLGERFDLSTFTFATLRGGGTGGAASTLFVSEYYAGFGELGAMASVAAFALLLAPMDHSLRKRMTSADALGAYAFLTGFAMRLPITQVLMGLGLPVASVMLYFATRAGLDHCVGFFSRPGHSR